MPANRSEGPERSSEPASGAHRACGEALLRASVAVVAGLVLGLGGALAALHLREPTSGVTAGSDALQAGRRSPPTSATSPTEPGGGGAASSHETVRTKPPPSSARTSGTGSPVEGAPPELASVSPSGGAAGQEVTISGANLFSPDGLIQASLGGVGAPVRCPSQRECELTVPAGLGPPRSLTLTIETQAGTSNALPFSYG